MPAMFFIPVLIRSRRNQLDSTYEVNQSNVLPVSWQAQNAPGAVWLFKNNFYSVKTDVQLLNGSLLSGTFPVSKLSATKPLLKKRSLDSLKTSLTNFSQASDLTTVLTQLFFNDLQLNTDSGKMSALVLLDLSTVFDIINTAGWAETFCRTFQRPSLVQVLFRRTELLWHLWIWWSGCDMQNTPGDQFSGLCSLICWCHLGPSPDDFSPINSVSVFRADK